jgi:hypothetical protein
VAGYLGEIRLLFTDEDFGEFFGGGEYSLQVFGPDPKGKTDLEGNRIIRELSETISVKMPLGRYGPPRLHILPRQDPRVVKKKAEEAAMQNQPNALNPFGVYYPGLGQPPVSTADASVTKASMDLATKMVADRQRELSEREKRLESDGGSKTLLEFVGGTSKQQMEAAQKEADRRESMWRDQLARTERQAMELREELKKVQQELEQNQKTRSGDTLEIVKLRDADAARLHENYRQQLDSARSAHDAQVKSLKEAHADELRREADRYKNQQDYYTRRLEELRHEADEKEKRLLTEIERVRSEERTHAERRITDAEKRFEDRIRDQEKAHERELRSKEDAYKTRIETATSKLDFELMHLRERVSDANKRAEEARSEAEKAKDPVTAIQEFKEKAKQLGMEEPDPGEPKTAWDRMAAAAGQGLGQALGRTDLTQLAAVLRGAIGQPRMTQATAQAAQLAAAQGAQRQLPPGARGQQRAPSARAMRWATDSSNQAHASEDVNLGEGMAISPKDEPGQSPPAPAGPAASVPPTAAAPGSQPSTPPPPSQPPPSAGQIRLPDHELVRCFGAESVIDFIQNMELAINTRFEASEFARVFEQKYPEQSAELARSFKPEDALAVVAAVPGAEASPVLRRDGKKWLAQLWEALKTRAEPPKS